MMAQPNGKSNIPESSRSLTEELRIKQKEEEVAAMIAGDLSFWMKPKSSSVVVKSVCRSSYKKPVGDTSCDIPTVSRGFVPVVAARHDNQYVMNNMLSCDGGTTRVSIISQEEAASLLEDEPKLNTCEGIFSTGLEIQPKNRKERRKAARDATIKKRVVLRPESFDVSFPTLGSKGPAKQEVGETPLISYCEMAQPNKSTDAEVEQSQSFVPTQTVAECVVNKLSISKQDSIDIEPCEESIYVDHSETMVQLPEASIPIKDGVTELLKQQFEKLGFIYHGFAVLRRQEGICYSVSFSEADRVPDYSNAREVLNILSGLGFEDFVVYGLREFMTLIPKVPAPLHRWQVILEKMSADDEVRESQMIYQLIHEQPLAVANSYYRPPAEEVIVSFQAEQECDTGDDAKSEGEAKRPSSQIARMKARAKINPDEMLSSGKTVSQWVVDWKQRQKERKKAKKVFPARQECDDGRLDRKMSGNVTDSSVGSKNSFIDDSIPRESGNTLKEKTQHLLKVVKNPDKVIGQRAWQPGKGTRTTETFSRTLANGLAETKQVITWSPDPVVPVERPQKPKWAKCPIEGFPVGVWRRYPTQGKTENELKMIARQIFLNFVRSEVSYLRNRWQLSKQRGINPWLSSATNITVAFTSNPIEDWWLAYTAWHEKAVAYCHPRATEEQKKWGVKKALNNDESD